MVIVFTAMHLSFTDWIDPSRPLFGLDGFGLWLEATSASGIDGCCPGRTARTDVDTVKARLVLPDIWVPVS